MVEVANTYCYIDESISALKLAKKNDDDQFGLTLKEKQEISHDTIMLTFALPDESWVLGLPVGGFLLFHAQIDGKTVTKRYTPVSPVNEKGTVKFVAKVYRKTEEFPNGGVFSQYLDTLKVGDQVMVEGPKGFLKYQGDGKFLIKNVPFTFDKMLLIAGGSGLTPCYQVVQAATLAKDSLKLTLIYSNKTEDDILAKKQLEEFANSNPNLKIVHTLTRVPEGSSWDGKKGRISAALCKEVMDTFDKNTLVGFCGPSGLNKCVEEMCVELGIAKENMFRF